jgi:hypothetical protein
MCTGNAMTFPKVSRMAAVLFAGALYWGTTIPAYGQKEEKEEKAQPQQHAAQPQEHAQPAKTPAAPQAKQEHAQPSKTPAPQQAQQHAQPAKTPAAPQARQEHAQPSKTPAPQQAQQQHAQPAKTPAAPQARQEHAQPAKTPAPQQAQQQHAQPAKAPAPQQQTQQAKAAAPQQSPASQQQPPHTQQQAQSWQKNRGWAAQSGSWQPHANFQQGRDQNWASDHRDWAQRGGYGGSYIPQATFGLDFGSSHFFHIGIMPVMYMGYPRFAYSGFSFLLVDPWPGSWQANWYASDDVYIDYDSGYYLYDRRYPGVRLAVMVAL